MTKQWHDMQLQVPSWECNQVCSYLKLIWASPGNIICIISCADFFYKNKNKNINMHLIIRAHHHIYLNSIVLMYLIVAHYLHDHNNYSRQITFLMLAPRGPIIGPTASLGTLTSITVCRDLTAFSELPSSSSAINITLI